jgi:hypothetical protein
VAVLAQNIEEPENRILAGKIKGFLNDEILLMEIY